jgi:hypothetical protein
LAPKTARAGGGKAEKKKIFFGYIQFGAKKMQLSSFCDFSPILTNFKVLNTESKTYFLADHGDI